MVEDQYMAAMARKPTPEDANRVPTANEQQRIIDARRREKMQNDPRTIAAKEQFAESRAEREAADQAKRDAIEQRKREQAEQQLEAEKKRARAGWLASGGDAEGFDREWPAIRDARLRERAIEHDDKAKAATERQYRAAM